MDWINVKAFTLFEEAQKLSMPTARLIPKKFENIYTETELEYFVSVLEQFKLANENDKPKKQTKTALKYLDKTIQTMRVLMRVLGIEIFFDQIFQRHKDSYSVECVVMLMNRCLKLYAAVDQLSTIFKLIEIQESSKSSNTAKSQKIEERLMCAIKSFLTQHTLFPVNFNFRGEDLLLKFRR